MSVLAIPIELTGQRGTKGGCGRLCKATIQAKVCSLRYETSFGLYVDEFNPSHERVARWPAMLLKTDGLGAPSHLIHTF